MQPFSVWISAEQWAPGEWNPADDAVDVVVTLGGDGSRWTATFLTFGHMERLRSQYRESGECLGGRYVWVAEPVFVDEASRRRIEEVVSDLLAAGEFRSAFRQLPAEISDPAI